MVETKKKKDPWPLNRVLLVVAGILFSIVVVSFLGIFIYSYSPRKECDFFCSNYSDYVIDSMRVFTKQTWDGRDIDGRGVLSALNMIVDDNRWDDQIKNSIMLSDIELFKKFPIHVGE